MVERVGPEQPAGDILEDTTRARPPQAGDDRGGQAVEYPDRQAAKKERVEGAGPRGGKCFISGGGECVVNHAFSPDDAINFTDRFGRWHRIHSIPQQTFDGTQSICPEEAVINALGFAERSPLCPFPDKHISFTSSALFRLTSPTASCCATASPSRWRPRYSTRSSS